MFRGPALRVTRPPVAVLSAGHDQFFSRPSNASTCPPEIERLLIDQRLPALADRRSYQV
jgi:hypothetical protein